MIRKTILLAAVLTLSALPGEPLEVEIGGKLAAGFGFLKGDDWLNQPRSAGLEQTTGLNWAGGAFADFVLHPNFSLQGGLGFARFSNRYAYATSTERRIGTLSVNLIDIPLLLRPGFEAGRGRVYACFGFNLMILLGDLSRNEQSEVVEIMEGLRPDRRFLWGGTGGLGYSFELGRGTALAELRYGRSFTPIFARSDVGLTEMRLALGYAVPLRRRTAAGS